MREMLISGEPGAGKTLLLLKLMKEFDNVIWVTTTRTAKTLRKILKNDDIWIIDAYAGTNVSTHPRNLVVSNPFNLNEINMKISQVLDQIKGETLVILDSITGLLLYHDLRKVVHFVKNALVKVKEKGASSVFTLVKHAHDSQTKTSLYAMFSTVVELLKKDNKETRRFVRIVKSVEYVEPNFGEVKIVRDDIILPGHIMDYIMRVLKSR
ncbi:hypothetical protein Arcpr_1188 [Archaeoglobus profundus DSM 5631]|uniref:Uncharacterized protein n=1 Tax=Archaeoglobus profundus (strain DSM 5631 / JCM 9629 / NBRC 100127 / Av18) TaxID=572546 RepID=D2RDP6_ARCPA|nr:hypothetical protein Arcpr_1188 [Archaeoglobus profundus DSM 5631]